jgi:hypothetical protein
VDLGGKRDVTQRDDYSAPERPVPVLEEREQRFGHAQSTSRGRSGGTDEADRLIPATIVEVPMS